MLNLITSSKIDKLCDELFNKLSCVNDIFSTQFVVVNNSLMEKMVKTHWLKMKKDVLMNVSFLRLNDLIKLVSTNLSYDMAKIDDYVFAITAVILRGQASEKIINDYIYDDGLLSAVKMRDFATDMARFFVLSEDNDIKKELWQEVLFREVKKELNNHKLLTRKDYLNEIKDFKLNSSIYLFCNGVISDLELDVIKRFSNVNDITMFVLDSDASDEVSLDFLKLGDYVGEKIKKNIDNVVTTTITDNNIVPVSVTLAPSKVREVEAVHSKICNILKKSDVKLSDILVVAPNISEYISAISRVFRQDDKEYIDIPYVVKTNMKKDTNLSMALSVFFDIYQKKFFTRLDFYKLVSNHLIQKVRGIDDSDVSCFIDIIDSMNVYRKKPNCEVYSDNHFNYAKRRMLISKLVGNNLNDKATFLSMLSEDDAYDYTASKIAGEAVLPFGAIDLTDERIVKFIEASDDINSFLELDEDNFLDRLEIELSKWFSCPDVNGIETNKLYRQVLDVISYFKSLDTTVSIDLLLTYLIDATKVSMGTSGEAFTQGVTFIDLNENQIVPCKYLFVMGFNSNAIPRNDRRSEFYANDAFLKKIDFDKYAFFGLVRNASGHVYISYLDKNLKTDEKYYESSFLDSIRKSKYLLFSDKKEEISIDETRSYKELYTRKEYKNKEYYSDLLKKTKTIVKEDKKDDDYSYTYSDIITLSNFQHFLEEPLKSKAERLMKNKDDNLSVIETEYEEFGFSALEKYSINEEVIDEIYDINDSDENSYALYHDIKDRIEEDLNLSHTIISKYDELEFEKVFSDSISTKKRIDDVLGKDYITKEIGEILLKCEDKEWIFSCNDAVFFHEDGLDRFYSKEKVVDKKPRIKEFIDLYLDALTDVAMLDSLDEYNITLIIVTLTKDKKSEKSFTITSSGARELLNKIYLAYNDYSDNKCIPINLDIAEDDLVKFMDSLKSDLNYDSPWRYYEDKRMFSDSDLGYSEDDFIDEYQKAYNKQLGLLKFMGKSDSDEL